MTKKHGMKHEPQGPFSHKVESSGKPNRKGSKKRGGKR